MAEADEYDNARGPFGWMDLIEALGIYESDDKNCLTDYKLIQLIEKCGGMQEYFLDNVDGKPPLVNDIRLLLRQACLWQQGKPNRNCKLSTRPRKAVRTTWHRHGRPPFPELCRILLRERADYHQIEHDLKSRRVKALASYASQIREGELVGLPGVWRNDRGTPPGISTHIDVDLRLFANSHRIITAGNWLIIGNLKLDEEDKEAVFDLKIRRKAHARILASRALHTAAEPAHAPTAETASGQSEMAAASEPPPNTSASVPHLLPVAPPQRWIPLHTILARPARLTGAPELHAHPPGAAVLEELWRALEAGQIRHQLVVGGAFLPPLAGLTRDQIDGRLLVGELWDSVDRVRGVLEHPPGVSRVIEICEDDVRAHFRAWSPAPAEAAGAPGPLRAPSAADLDDCIEASAAKSPDGKTSGRQLRDDAPPWFAAHAIRPVTQADMERRLNENNAMLRRGTGKRRG
jgi:hypothetical protein